jgi:hypothetical protein
LETFKGHIDFAHVDGDHETAGVMADVCALLSSPKCNHAVILCHDSHNRGVREGIDLAVASCIEKVSYYEPRFLPGYTFASGPFVGQDWGGFALILTGEGSAQVQGLYADHHAG